MKYIYIYIYDEDVWLSLYSSTLMSSSLSSLLLPLKLMEFGDMSYSHDVGLFLITKFGMKPYSLHGLLLRRVFDSFICIIYIYTIHDISL